MTDDEREELEAEELAALNAADLIPKTAVKELKKQFNLPIMLNEALLIGYVQEALEYSGTITALQLQVSAASGALRKKFNPITCCILEAIAADMDKKALASIKAISEFTLPRRTAVAIQPPAPKDALTDLDQDWGELSVEKEINPEPEGC